jgi:hypothetical protein
MLADLRAAAKVRKLTKKELAQVDRMEGWEAAKAAKKAGTWVRKGRLPKSGF